MVDYLLDTKDKSRWQQPILDKDLSAPPDDPSKGDRYIVGASPTGDWAGHADDIAEWNGSAWIFTTAFEGMITYVMDEDELYEYITAWQLLPNKAAAQADSTASDVPGIVADFNALLAKLRASDLMAS